MVVSWPWRQLREGRCAPPCLAVVEQHLEHRPGLFDDAGDARAGAHGRVAGHDDAYADREVGRGGDLDRFDAAADRAREELEEGEVIDRAEGAQGFLSGRGFACGAEVGRGRDGVLVAAFKEAGGKEAEPVGRQ